MEEAKKLRYLDIKKAAVKSKTAKPNSKAVPKSQKVKKNTKITLTAPKNVTLYYTIDGTKPTTKSKKISPKKYKEIKIKSKTTVKVIAMKKGCSQSSVVTRTYTIK